MEALRTRAALVSAALFFLSMFAGSADAASGYRTANFVVSAPSPQLAQQIGDTAEVWRKKLAVEWLGREMPDWSKPCRVHAKVAPQLGAGGATSFVFDRGEVFDWQMNIQGSRERILDSVLPHEITHTIFASHFRQPLPRWADEGACTTVEHVSEVAKQERMLIQFLKSGRGIPFSQMFAMKEYPSDVLPLYSQGHSLCQLLIESRGKRAFLDFLADGMEDENWPRAVKKHYGFDNLFALQNSWLDWVRDGRPRLTPSTAPGDMLATRLATDVSESQSHPAGAWSIYRGQSPDSATRGDQKTSVYVSMAEQPAQTVDDEPQSSEAKSVYDASGRPRRLLR